MCCSVFWLCSLTKSVPTATYIATCSVLQCVAVCCSVLQCVAVCCSVLQSNQCQLQHTLQLSVSLKSCYVGTNLVTGHLKVATFSAHGKLKLPLQVTIFSANQIISCHVKLLLLAPTATSSCRLKLLILAPTISANAGRLKVAKLAPNEAISSGPVATQE